MKTNLFSLKQRASILNSGLAVILMLFIVSIIVVSCHCCDKKPLIEIKEAIKAPLGIAFIDANLTTMQNVPKVRVTLIDSAKMVVSSNGIHFETVEVTGGVMSIGLSQEAAFTTEKPYRFFVRAEADGYMTNIYPVVVNEDRPSYLPIFMAKLDALPPSGVEAAVGNIANVENGVIKSDAFINTSGPKEQKSPMTIRIKEGTRLLCDGRPVDAQGPLSYRLLFGAPRDSNANRLFPGGFEVTDAVDENGKPMNGPANPFYFTTAGWFSMEMNVGATGINAFSEPLQVEMPILDTVINPDTHKPVKVGDAIPLWSLDNRTGVWKREAVAVVDTAGGGGMKVHFEVRHLSTWNIDYPGPQCTGTIRLNYTNADFSQPGLYYRTELIRESDGAHLQPSWHPLVDLGSGSPLDIILAPIGTPSVVLVHENSLPVSQAYGVSSVVSCTNGTTTTGTLSRIGTPATCIQVEFRDASNSSLFSVCNNSVWHKNNCSDPIFSLSNFLTGSSAVAIPRVAAQIHKCLRVWYLNSAGHQTSLDFDLDLSVPDNTNQANQPGTMNAGLPSQSNFLFSYIKNTAIPSSCSTPVLQIFVPHSIITGGVCPN